MKQNSAAFFALLIAGLGLGVLSIALAGQIGKEQPDREVREFRDLIYLRPNETSGLSAGGMIGDCFSATGCPHRWTLFVTNLRSYMHIDGDTGEVETWEHVHPEDTHAFTRFAASITVLNRTTEETDRARSRNYDLASP